MFNPFPPKQGDEATNMQVFTGYEGNTEKYWEISTIKGPRLKKMTIEAAFKNFKEQESINPEESFTGVKWERKNISIELMLNLTTSTIKRRDVSILGLKSWTG